MFLNHRKFETERDTSDMHDIKPLDLQAIWWFDLSFFFVSLSVPKLRRFGIVGAINTFETAGTHATFPLKILFIFLT